MVALFRYGGRERVDARVWRSAAVSLAPADSSKNNESAAHGTELICRHCIYIHCGSFNPGR